MLNRKKLNNDNKNTSPKISSVQPASVFWLHIFLTTDDRLPRKFWANWENLPFSQVVATDGIIPSLFEGGLGGSDCVACSREIGIQRIYVVTAQEKLRLRPSLAEEG